MVAELWRGGTSILRRRAEALYAWKAGLPGRWVGSVIVPAYFVRYREYEIRAERIVGFEYEDQPCYCEHRVDFGSLESGAPAAVPAAGGAPQYWEHSSAWRLVDGHWLILKRLRSGTDVAQVQEFFCLAGQMPR